MLAHDNFVCPTQPTHRQYEALRAHYVDGYSPAEAAAQFGYTLSAYYSLMHQLRTQLTTRDQFATYFFVHKQAGRKPRENQPQVEQAIVELRKKYLSVPDIKAVLDTLAMTISESAIYLTLKRNGFARLPRRADAERDQTLAAATVQAPPSRPLAFTPEAFTTHNTLGLICLLPYLQRYGIDQLISTSPYPQTKRLDRLRSILSFVALKLASVKRYTHDDLW